MRIIRLILLSLALVAMSMPATAQRARIVKKSELAADTTRNYRALEDSLRVIVGNDTVSMIIPEHNFGRYDRGLFNYLFIPKGCWTFGLTASYGELNTDDVQILSILKNVDFKGKIYSIKPSISYFFRNNQSIGLQFDYSRGVADLNNLALDFDDDLNFSIRDVSYYTQTFSIATTYRNYVGLGMDKRFAVFNQVDLSFSAGSSRFKRLYNDVPKDTRTIITQAGLNFSPGVSMCIQDNLAFCVSFGVFGIKMRREKQTTDGIYEGSRFTSGANFKFNIFNINFGLMVII